MLQNYSKLIKAATVLILPIWVLIGFYSAQAVAVNVVALMLALKRPLDSYDSAVVNSSVAAFVYVATLLIVIGIPYLLNRKRTSLADVGLNRLPTWTDIFLTPAALVTYFILSAILIMLATNVLPGFNVNQVQDTGFDQLSARYEYILAFMTLVVIAPIAEEVLFRGYLYGKLKKFVPVWAAIVVTSVLFGFIHGAWNLAVDTFALSVVLCLLRESTGSIWSSILLHMAKNGIAFYILFINPSLLSILVK
ncbi:hypothetical protein COV88_01855 [Candidatus Saccharibacteria bacterium CG11_big_fil_rev_8_21_14_0_20_41_19]|nr:CPBP family intramembrane metalloprotease [Candidatus Saccharibacteria bacterium]OIP85751.1 MAG: hypothetical protein AUK57_02765 [Candidatus Saccharibacteria bacterium CG2_30_41_52]PIQ70867.1 MAG: hypothetical protein COV88_01855 [Candidatus Saccharibacteria bacterium CG11_big_fil_rev_8_21_14_0_20_41_19]PIZ61218.1 MAG: hypothetical protein COY18_00350 [Candidatus Saccharibacteria bacterium CG_4_10_14_0_2_um_filter_41_11]PJC29656.1 MAG: hypothetical protein CO052_02095 [Candidatus Sacchariba